MRARVMSIVQSVRRACGGRKGQATVEYALLVIAVLAIVLGMGALARAISSGALSIGVLDSLSHRLPKGVLDIALF